MSNCLEVKVSDEIGNQRMIVLDGWSYKAGSKAWSSPGEYLDNPPEGAEMDDLEAHWHDNKEDLTEEEMELYLTEIEKAIIEESEGDQ